MYYQHHQVYVRRDAGLQATPEQIYQAAVMHEQGLPYTVIGRKLGFSNMTVSRWHYAGKFQRALQQRAGGPVPVLAIDL